MIVSHTRMAPFLNAFTVIHGHIYSWAHLFDSTSPFSSTSSSCLFPSSSSTSSCSLSSTTRRSWQTYAFPRPKRVRTNSFTSPTNYEQNKKGKGGEEGKGGKERRERRRGKKGQKRKQGMVGERVGHGGRALLSHHNDPIRMELTIKLITKN